MKPTTPTTPTTHTTRIATRIALCITLLITAALLLTACKDKAGGQQLPTSEEPSPSTQLETSPDSEEFVFTRSNFPRMDGSTSTAPLAQAAACVLLGETREAVADLAIFNRTTQSFRNLAAGTCDILIVSEPAPEVFDELSKLGFECEIAPIATDALVFVVNSANPVDSLTREEIRRIYTGKIKNWYDVGGKDITIKPFQRNAEAGSQVLMEKLVMEGLNIGTAPEQEFTMAFGMGELITGIKGFDGSANAIGYTVYYYAEDMRMAEGLKILSVDGIKPGVETIKSGEYPFLSPYYVVIGADEPEDSPARIMYNWLLSDEGQALASREGYVPAR